jgi:hypothetical protein
LIATHGLDEALMQAWQRVAALDQAGDYSWADLWSRVVTIICVVAQERIGMAKQAA